MKSIYVTFSLFAWIVFPFAPLARAGAVVVSGDSTPSFYLTNTSPDPAMPGNRQFFANVLGAGKNVVVRTPSFNGSLTEINEFYGSLSGVTSSLVAAPISPGQLSSANLLVASAPSTSFSAAEMSAIANFVNAGGSALLLGEANAATFTFGPTTNGYINNLLTSLGANLSIVTSVFDIGDQLATESQIANHPLTSGVAGFSYGATSLVSAGQPLFFTHENAPFVAVAFVPEPTAAFSLMFAAAALATARYRGINNLK